MGSPDFLPILFDKTSLLLGLITGLFVFSLRKAPPVPRFIEILLFLGTIYVMTFTPAESKFATDRENYAYLFNQGDDPNVQDLGFLAALKFLSSISGDTTFFFFVCAIIYVTGYYVFVRSLSYDKSFYVFIAIFMSLGFLSYNLNTLRQGLSLSFLLMAIQFDLNNKKPQFYVFSGIGVLFHFAGALLLFSYFISRYFKIKYCYLIWGIAFLLSVTNLSATIMGYINLSSDKLTSYVNYSDTVYKVGFRWDFLVYSLFPMFVGGFYLFKLHYRDKRYIMIYRTYILMNSIWLFFIRIPYTDRVAYLSWVFIPILLLMPALDHKQSGHAAHRPEFVGLFLLVVSFINWVI